MVVFKVDEFNLTLDSGPHVSCPRHFKQMPIRWEYNLVTLSKSSAAKRG